MHLHNIIVTSAQYYNTCKTPMIMTYIHVTLMCIVHVAFCVNNKEGNIPSPTYKG